MDKHDLFYTYVHDLLVLLRVIRFGMKIGSLIELLHCPSTSAYVYVYTIKVRPLLKDTMDINSLQRTLST